MNIVRLFTILLALLCTSSVQAAITFSNLGASANPDINSGTDTSSYSNTSWTPPTSGLILLCVVNDNSANNQSQLPTVSGNSITWTQIATVQYGGAATNRRETLFGANASGSTTGTTTVDFSAVTQSFVSVLFAHATGVDLSGGVAAAFVQAPTNTCNSGCSAAANVTLSSASNANNRPFACFSNASNEVQAPRTNWTELDDLQQTSTDVAHQSQYRDDTFETTASSTWVTGSVWGAIAVELSSEGAAPVAPRRARLITFL